MTELKMPEDQIYCKSEVNGKMIKITAVFENEWNANIYLSKHPDEGAIYQAESFVFCAKLSDLGIKKEKT